MSEWERKGINAKVPKRQWRKGGRVGCCWGMVGLAGLGWAWCRVGLMQGGFLAWGFFCQIPVAMPPSLACYHV